MKGPLLGLSVTTPFYPGASNVKATWAYGRQWKQQGSISFLHKPVPSWLSGLCCISCPVKPYVEALFELGLLCSCFPRHASHTLTLCHCSRLSRATPFSQKLAPYSLLSRDLNLSRPRENKVSCVTGSAVPSRILQPRCNTSSHYF